MLYFTGEPETDPVTYPFFARYKVWKNPTGKYRRACQGSKYIHGLCIFSYEDLPRLATRWELFVNKFHISPDYLALDCMEELHFNRTRQDYEENSRFDLSPYKNLSFITNRVGEGIKMN